MCRSINRKLPLLILIMGLLVGGCSRDVTLERPNHPLPEGVDIAECEPGQYGGAFVLSGASEPRTFNPLVAEDAYSAEAIRMMLAGLVDYNPITEEYQPALAQSWEVGEDQKTYTFHLRRGVRWSDGTPFTADDVIFTLDVIFDPRFPNRYSLQYTIGGEPLRYRKIDDHTVEFTTPRIYAPFINDIGFISILPKHALKEAADAGTLMRQWSSQTAIETPEKLIASGPFLVHSFKPGERLVMSPNPHYWRADREGKRLPYIDYLIFKFVSDQNAQNILFATGQTDAAGISPTDLMWISRGEKIYDFRIIERGPDSGISFIWFNQHPGKNSEGKPYVQPYKLKWFTNQKFRQAIAHAINRPGIVQAVYFGRAEPLYSSITPANRKWHNPNTIKYDYNPERARELLKEAGFRYNDNGVLVDSDGHPVEFELIVNEGSQTAPAIATTIMDNLLSIGIQMRLQYLDFGTMVAKVSQSFDYEAAMMGFTGGGDPSGGKAIWRSDGRLHVWYPNQPQPATEWEARIDEIMELQEQELDEEKRIALIHEKQLILSEQSPLIFLVNPLTYSGIKNRWRNVQVPPLGSIIWNLDELWTDQP